MRFLYSSGFSALSFVQSSSVIAALQRSIGSASSPAGYRNLSSVLSTMLPITFATADAGVGNSRDALNNASIYSPWRYRDPGLAWNARAIGVSIIPGCTMATRKPNGFTSCASTSLTASRANFEAAYAPSGEEAILPATDVTLIIHPFRLSRLYGRTWRIHRKAPK